MGIVTTFTATIDVIKQTSKHGANFIITHEPTFYDHNDSTDRLQKDSVYQCKKKLIEDNNIAIYRFHDYWHLRKPDGILHGFVKLLGWNQYEDYSCPVIFNIPAIKINSLVYELKEKLGLQYIRMSGQTDMICRRIAVLLGAVGGDAQMNFICNNDFDVLICGETAEWQTCEYFRDLSAVGGNKALLILGHANSEEAGMRYLVELLKTKVSDIPIKYIPSGDPVKFL